MAKVNRVNEWNSLANKRCEKEIFLHSFNAKNELNKFNCNEREALWELFSKFLQDKVKAGVTLQEVFNSSDVAIQAFLGEFSKETAIKRGMFVPLCGNHITTASRNLCTQQNFFFASNSDWLLRAQPQFRSVMRPLLNHLANSHFLDKDDWRTWLNKHKDISDSVVNFVFDDGFEEFDASEETHKYESKVIWLTFKEELEKLVNCGVLKKSSLRSSWSMAKQRYITGLYHESDSETHDAFITAVLAGKTTPVNDNKLALKTFINFQFEPKENFKASQPTIFSNGYNDLFVSEMPDAKLGGRACRLKLKTCGHIKCKCAAKGVPEIVTSAYQIMVNTKFTISDIALMRPNHLSRYEKPSVAFIESKRGKSA